LYQLSRRIENLPEKASYIKYENEEEE
jgi:hypothetical protein